MEAIRDQWLLPLVDRIGTLERENGRLEQERDQLRVELDTMRVAGDVADSPQDAQREPTPHERREAFWHAPAGAPTILRAWIRRLLGR
jgi:hypothetical protein